MATQKQRIFVKGEDKTDSIRAYRKNGNKVDITYSNGKTYSYASQNVRVVASALADHTANRCFDYLAALARTVGLVDPQVGNILANHYARIEFVSPDSVLAPFLSGQFRSCGGERATSAIYPFGFNASQKQAVDLALSNSLSIIEGPPGTGKTQTILNIIANAVMRGESVAVVSSNNSATANIFEKLVKYNTDFIAARLGNSDNKREFIELQRPLPDLGAWRLSTDRHATVQERLQTLFVSLSSMLAKKNELSRLKQEHDGIEIEYRHFAEYCDRNKSAVRIPFLQNAISAAALELWLLFEHYAAKGKKPRFFERLRNRFKYGITDKALYDLAPEILITGCQKRYYDARKEELTASIALLEKTLATFDFKGKMQEYSNLSAELFRDKLACRYGKNERKTFTLGDLWNKPEEFIAAYPVTLSTTYSLRSSLSYKVMFDYVIIDESSQVDIVTGALALSCAKKAVVVGDLKQLPNVVDRRAAEQTDAIFARFDLPEVYRYRNHSLLSSIMEIFQDAPRTLLREHYRCHPKIIEFCSRKFYNSELIVLTEPRSDRQPLVVYQTADGNHARDHTNQRQIDVIMNEVIPQQNLDTRHGSVGIVTPYRNQTNALQSAFADTSIKADTVDKFQGRENDIIVLSTVDNEVGEFADNANRLNVAISRAIDQLIVVVSAADIERDTNIGDLIRYIRYNNIEIIQSRIYSVFDYLYNGYAEKRRALLGRHKRISEFDSENLMYILIEDILKYERFSRYDVAVHVPLKMIVRDTDKFDDNERRYAMNILTHVDFLIFDKLDKSPHLAIEVDGVSYHKSGTRQAERDKLKNAILDKCGLKWIRLKTNESGERQRLVDALS